MQNRKLCRVLWASPADTQSFSQSCACSHVSCWLGACRRCCQSVRVRQSLVSLKRRRWKLCWTDGHRPSVQTVTSCARLMSIGYQSHTIILLQPGTSRPLLRLANIQTDSHTMPTAGTLQECYSRSTHGTFAPRSESTWERKFQLPLLLSINDNYTFILAI